jgi:hypothetical protein
VLAAAECRGGGVPQLGQLALELCDVPRLRRQVAQKEGDDTRVRGVKARLDLEHWEEQAPDVVPQGGGCAPAQTPRRAQGNTREVVRAMEMASISGHPLIDERR